MAKELNLMLHCGANKVVKGELVDVPTPSNTDTWFPIPHNDLLARVETMLRRSNYEIVNEAYGLSHDGARFFGIMQVSNDHVDSDYSMVVGIRNSHDKTFPAALALGSGVFVCDNLAFSGEIKLARKHTRFINRDLPHVVAKAVGRLADQRIVQDQRIAAYKTSDIDDARCHDLVIHALDCKATVASKIPRTQALHALCDSAAGIVL